MRVVLKKVVMRKAKWEMASVNAIATATPVTFFLGVNKAVPLFLSDRLKFTRGAAYLIGPIRIQPWHWSGLRHRWHMLLRV